MKQSQKSDAEREDLLYVKRSLMYEEHKKKMECLESENRASLAKEEYYKLKTQNLINCSQSYLPAKSRQLAENNENYNFYDKTFYNL